MYNAETSSIFEESILINVWILDGSISNDIALYYKQDGNKIVS